MSVRNKVIYWGIRNRIGLLPFGPSEWVRSNQFSRCQKRGRISWDHPEKLCWRILGPAWAKAMQNRDKNWMRPSQNAAWIQPSSLMLFVIYTYVFVCAFAYLAGLLQGLQRQSMWSAWYMKIRFKKKLAPGLHLENTNDKSKELTDNLVKSLCARMYAKNLVKT